MSRKKAARTTKAIKADFDAAHVAGMEGLRTRDYGAFKQALNRETELIAEARSASRKSAKRKAAKKR